MTKTHYETARAKEDQNWTYRLSVQQHTELVSSRKYKDLCTRQYSIITEGGRTVRGSPKRCAICRGKSPGDNEHEHWKYPTAIVPINYTPKIPLTNL